MTESPNSPPQDVALVELGQSDSDSEVDEQTTDSEEETDSEGENEITEQNLKLPGNKDKKKKVNIQVVSLQEEQDS